jgi:hypothetical protein
MRKRIDHPESSGVVEPDGMRILEHPFAPELHKFALRRIDLHGNLAAVECPDIAIRAEGDAGHGRSPLPARWLF